MQIFSPLNGKRSIFHSFFNFKSKYITKTLIAVFFLWWKKLKASDSFSFWENCFPFFYLSFSDLIEVLLFLLKIYKKMVPSLLILPFLCFGLTFIAGYSQRMHKWCSLSSSSLFLFQFWSNRPSSEIPVA